MTHLLSHILLILGAYLLGSLPIGLYIGKMVKGIDVREFGSGNIGASNVWRTLGPAWGILVFLLDVSKGLLPTVTAHHEWHISPWWPILTGMAAICGHNCSPFLHFKGGKGVATSLGVVAGLSPPAALLGFAVWGLCLAVTRFISVSSMIAAVVCSALLWDFNGRQWPYGLFGILAALFVIVKHRSNMRRLRNGTEPKVGRQ